MTNDPENGVSRRGFVAGAAALAASTLWTPGARAQSPPVDGWDAVPGILRRIQAPVFPDRAYRVTDFGARGDGRSDARQAFERAIDRCNAEGGGRVVVPAGTWWTEGPIHLKSNVHLHLEDGATIRFTPDPKRYPLVLTKWEGTECFNHSPMVYAYQASNVAITGRGTLDGNSKETFATWKPRQAEAQNRLREMGAADTPLYQRVFGEGSYLRPVMIQFFGCRNVHLEGFTVVDSPFWIVHPLYCQNVIARGLRMESRNLNNDGVDPESSTDVLIESCVFHTGDDGVAVKAGRDRDAWRVGRATENVIVRNCDMSSDANGLVIGSEMSGGVRGVYMENCRIGNATNSAIYFKSNLDRGGSVERIRIRNVQVADAGTFIHFTTRYQGYRGGQSPTRFQDIVLDGITCRSTRKAIHAVGVPEAKLRDVLLCRISVERADVSHEIAHVENFTLRDVRINGTPVTLPAQG